LLGQCESSGQKLAGDFHVSVGQNGHAGGAEIELIRVLLGHGENGAHVLLSAFGAHAASREFGILGVWPFDVHGEHVHQPRVEQFGHHLGALAVGVQLDGQAQDAEIGEDARQTWNHRGLASGDGNAVQPGLAGLQKIHDRIASQGRHALRPPGQLPVVACGAPEVAPAGEEHGADLARPVAQAHFGQTAHKIPVIVVLHTKKLSLPAGCSPPQFGRNVIARCRVLTPVNNAAPNAGLVSPGLPSTRQGGLPLGALAYLSQLNEQFQLVKQFLEFVEKHYRKSVRR